MEDDVSDNASGETLQMHVEETRCIISYFKRKVREDDMFYWDMEIDDRGSMGSIFWRDGRSRSDYDCFGDVVFLYCTSLEFGTIYMCIGVNHHWQNVMFGCAYLIYESEAWFVWLLKTFLESMGNQPPRTIITSYDDEELGRAIKLVLPTTRHRLSLQCIFKRASLKFRCHNSNERLLQLFDKCLRECETEVKFEETWRKMVFEFGVEDDSWFNMLYRNRRKWCPALTKDCFDGGIESSQRSESSKCVLNSTIETTDSLGEFVKEFDKLLEAWRQNEAKENSLCRRNRPQPASKHSDILKHAAKHYTPTMYKLFEEEFLDGCCASSSKQTLCGDALCRFEFTMQGRDSEVWVVNLDISTMELSCSCNKFNSMGMLCSHALKALTLKNINTIPQKYIIERWTKYAKKGIYKLEEQPKLLRRDFPEDEFIYHNLAIRYTNDFVMRSRGNKKAKKIIWDAFVLGKEKLDSLFENECLDENSGCRDSSDESESGAIRKRLKSSLQGKSTSEKQLVDQHQAGEHGDNFAAQTTAQMSNINRVSESPPKH